MKKKIFLSVISVILSVCLVFGSVLSASASSASTADILLGLLGGGSTSGSVNVSQMFTQWLQGVATEEGPFDKIVENIKNQFNGTSDSTEDDPDADKEEIAVIDKAEAGNIAELFNVTVNELKKGAPAFVKTESASLSNSVASSLQGYIGPINGIVASLVGNKDLAAAVIDGVNTGITSVKSKFQSGNDVKNNISVSGKDYVSCLTAEDIKDYTITVYKSGAYKMHIDLVDAQGAASQSGLSHVFDTSDKATATLNLMGVSLNIGIMFKYVNNYVECQVNRSGEITSYTQHMGVTFMFKDSETGEYTTKVPYLGVDLAEEGLVYEFTTDYSGINFALRLMGDANNDGKMNSTDARLVLRIASGLDELIEADKKYIDINQDGKVTANDAREILRASAGLSEIKSTAEILGLTEYKRSDAVQNQITDLLVLIVAYQNAKTASEQQKLEDYYNDKYSGAQTSTTTAVVETTTKKMDSNSDKVNNVIGAIGDIIGGFIKK